MNNVSKNITIFGESMLNLIIMACDLSDYIFHWIGSCWQKAKLPNVTVSTGAKQNSNVGNLAFILHSTKNTVQCLP